MEFKPVDGGPQSEQEAMEATDNLKVELLEWVDNNGGVDPRIVLAALGEVLAFLAIVTVGVNGALTMVDALKLQVKETETQLSAMEWITDDN